ncbi:MAG: hypothetical protein AB7G23_09485 [Vicinamibacterales bacterium]
MGNSDPALTYLKSFGYSVVRLPRADIRPLLVLVLEGNRLSRLGDLATVLQPGGTIALPTVKQDVPAANIAGQKSRDLSFGVGLSILGNIIGAMGGSKLGLDVAYKNAKSISFEFSDVLADDVDLISLDQFLTDADVNPFSTHVSRLLESDAVYVTSGVIKTKKFIIDARTSDGTSVDVQIPEIQNLVGGNVKVGTSGESASKVVYESAVPLAFGFQAARLYYEEGRYTAFKPLEPGQAGLEAARGARGADYLSTDSPFARLD